MNAPTPIRTCHACDQAATQQWQREATEQEAANYHQAMYDFRTSQGLPPMPETAAIRQAPVQVAMFGCDDHGQESADAEP